MKQLAKNALLVLVSLAISAVLAEAVLRLAGFSYPNFYRHDIQTGTTLRPGAEGWWREEGESFVRINAAGMRDDREIAQGKENRVYRVAILGDSYAEALQVPLQLTFWRLLEEKLNACDFAKGKRIEILNFGVSGYSTAQELLTLQHRAAAYAPDLVLLAFLSGNDVRDNSREIAGAYPRPYFLLEQGALSLDTSFRDPWIFRLKSNAVWQFGNHSRIFQLLNKVKSVVGHPLSALPTDQQVLDVGLDDHIYLSSPPEAWERAWQLTERLIAEIRSETTRLGARFVLVTLTNPGQVPADAQRMREHAEKLGERDLFYPERRMRAFAKRERIEAVFLAQDFAEIAAAQGTHLHGFANTQLGSGHWNEIGHALAADLIAQRLCTSDVNTSPTRPDAPAPSRPLLPRLEKVH